MFDFKEGEFYRTRDGRKVEILKTGFQRIDAMGGTNEIVAAVITDIKNNGNVSQDILSYNVQGRNGMYNERWDIERIWTDPVYQWFSVFVAGPDKELFEDKDECLEYAGKKATSQNPLVAVCRIDLATNEFSIEKLGESG